jgi:hypothetical protein
MTTQIKRRRGTTAEHASFTGAEGEITIDTTKDTAVVHDGATAGGHPLAKENGSTFTNVDINSGTIDGTTIGGASAGAGTFTGLTVSDADGATVRIQSSDTSVDGGSLGQLEFFSNDASTGGTGVKGKIEVVDNGSSGQNYDMNFYTGYVTGGAHTETKKMTIGPFGDISFYEDTGTTPKFFWDASTERLGIGNQAPATALDVTGTVTADGLVVDGNSQTTTLKINTASSAWADTNADDLIIRGTDIGVTLSSTGTGNLFFGDGTGAQKQGQIKYDHSDDSMQFSTAGSDRLRITSAGIDVTGTVTADGLTVDGGALIQAGNGATATLSLNNGDGNGIISQLNLGYTADPDHGNIQYTGDMIFSTGANKDRLNIAGNGDISFYEDTGVTAKFFWDASAESLGIGYSGANLVNTKLALGDTSASNTVLQMYSSTTGNNTIRFGDVANSDPASFSGYIQYNHASDYMRFATGATERLRIDSSGQVGIGTESPSQKLQVDGGAFRVTGNYSSIANNQGLMLGYTGDSASYYAVGANGGGIGQHIFYGYNYSTGAGSERMRIDASGNLGIGTPSPEFKADFIVDNGDAIAVRPATATLNATQTALRLYGHESVLTSRYVEIASVNGAGTNVNNMVFKTGSGTTVAEAMRIDSSGNVGIGATLPSAKLDVKVATDAKLLVQEGNTAGNVKMQAVNNAVSLNTNLEIAALNTQFFNGGTERMRINSSGNLLVGQAVTGSYEDGRVATTSTGTASSFKTTTVGAACSINWNSATSGDNLFEYFVTETSPSVRGSIDYNRAGGLTRYNTTSDYRAKDIIGPVQNVGETIDALKVYEGVMKGATQSRPMLVAHEAQEYAPYAVTGVKDEVDENGTPKFQQMDVSSLVPLLLAEIQDLRKRIAILESN